MYFINGVAMVVIVDTTSTMTIIYKKSFSLPRNCFVLVYVSVYCAMHVTKRLWRERREGTHDVREIIPFWKSGLPPEVKLGPGIYASIFSSHQV